LTVSEDSFWLFTVIVFVIRIVPGVHVAHIPASTLLRLRLNLNLEEFVQEHCHRVHIQMASESLEHIAVAFVQKVLEHGLASLVQQTLEDFEEVAAKNFEHLGVLGTQEVID
jgi:hypothetical protein